MRFILVCIDCRRSSPEVRYLVLSLMRYLTSRAAPLVTTYAGLADWQDYVQEIIVHFLAHLHEYDASRGAITTWLRAWAMNATQDLLAETSRGFARPSDAPADMSRLVQALNARPIPPQTELEWRTMARESTGRSMKLDTIRAYLRLAEPVRSLTDLSTDALATTMLVGSDPSHMADKELLAVLDKHTVRDALAQLSPSRRDRLAEQVGLEERSVPTQRAIAARLGISQQAVSQAIRLGSQAIKNTAALGALDEVAVDYHDPEGPGHHSQADV